MRRFLTLVLLLCTAIPAGVSLSGCTRNPAANYCNGLGYGAKITDVYTITLEPKTTDISLAFGQTKQVTSPTATTCKGASAGVKAYTYGTSNNQLVDISPSGNMCAGTWNRNSGGGIADYTICNVPNPIPSTGGLPYSSAYVTASADSVVSNPLQIFVHQQVSSVSLSLGGTSANQCYSQGDVAQLDAEACYVKNGVQYELCAPSSVTTYACSGGVEPGVTSLPSCNSAIGVLTFAVGTSSVASINSETNQITAALPGTTAITASVAGSGSSAGYFSTCPPKTISVTLNGKTSGTVTKGVTQNLTTVVTDTAGNTITGLNLDYQSTNIQDITAGSGGAVSATYPGSASVYAICQPASCNQAPINQVGLYGTGLPISSNPVAITTPGTASAYVWYAAPGKSRYFVPVQLLSGTVGSNVRMPYVPNSMVMDKSSTNLYFGSARELMIYSTSSNGLSKEDTNVPGVVLAVAPNNSTALINDPVRQLFYVYTVSSGSYTTYGGLGVAAQWTPDSKTLYVVDSASAGTGHADRLYVYNANTGWTSYDLSASGGATNLAVTVPSVGAYLGGTSTVAHTWCPSGTAADYASIQFYPEGDSVPVESDKLAATSDGNHVLGATLNGSAITLNDIGVTIPTTVVNNIKLPLPCSVSGNTLTPLTLTHTLNPVNVNGVTASAVNQIVASPSSGLAFITYTGSTPGATLPYYIPAASGAGTLNYLTLTGSSAITAPIAGAFSPDNTTFFVSTTGDNQIHYIDVGTMTDTQQISPNLPACTPGTDTGCTLPAAQSDPVPASAIAVKPRATT